MPSLSRRARRARQVMPTTGGAYSPSPVSLRGRALTFASTLHRPPSTPPVQARPLGSSRSRVMSVNRCLEARRPARRGGRCLLAGTDGSATRLLIRWHIPELQRPILTARCERLAVRGLAIALRDGLVPSAVGSAVWGAACGSVGAAGSGISSSSRSNNSRVSGLWSASRYVAAISFISGLPLDPPADMARRATEEMNATAFATRTSTWPRLTPFAVSASRASTSPALPNGRSGTVGGRTTTGLRLR
jgi:hypothetical protein